MHARLAGCAREASDEPWKCIHFHFASICMPTAWPLLLFRESREFMLVKEAVFRSLTPRGGGGANNANPFILSPWLSTLKFIILSEVETTKPLKKEKVLMGPPTRS